MNKVCPTQSAFKSWFKQQCEVSLKQGQRVVCVLSGNQDWARQVCLQSAGVLHNKLVLQVATGLPGAILPSQCHTQLGEEFDVIVFDAHDKLDPDALGAVSGTLRQGGVFFLLLPSLAGWEELARSRFLRRLVELGKALPGIYLLEQQQAYPACIVVNNRVTERQTCQPPYLSHDQQHVVESIVRAALDVKPIPVVVNSDRGRGKSAALGLAAAQLMVRGISNILVTAPRMATSEPLFRHACQQLPGGHREKGRLDYQQASLRFVAPDALLESQPGAELLIVDEAAAIPLPMLQQLLARYPQTVFSSTIHGYEGTGRGFELKFRQYLEKTSPANLWLTMKTPIRWQQHDFLEAWTGRVLCLDAELALINQPENISFSDCELVCVDRDSLSGDEQKLSSLFALLVHAHYRTQPSDLQHLLDDPNVRLYTLEYQQQIIGALLVNQEGGFDASLSSAIYRGERRPAGHLLAQTLTFHAGCESAAMLRYARIMRIAIHPELQRKGLGSDFLNKVVLAESKNDVDAIGCSFGASPGLLRFWQGAGFDLVRIGFTQDHVSATHSAVLLQPFSSQGQQVFVEARQRFRRSLSDWLSAPLSGLPDDMKTLLMKQSLVRDENLTSADWQDIVSFAYTHRSYAACMSALKRVTRQCFSQPQLTPMEQALISACVIDDENWAQVVKMTGLTGKNEALKKLREVVKKILLNCPEYETFQKKGGHNGEL